MINTSLARWHTNTKSLPVFYYNDKGYVSAALVEGRRKPFGVSVYSGGVWNTDPNEFDDMNDAMRYGETVAAMEAWR